MLGVPRQQKGPPVETRRGVHRAAKERRGVLIGRARREDDRRWTAVEKLRAALARAAAGRTRRTAGILSVAAPVASRAAAERTNQETSPITRCGECSHWRKTRETGGSPSSCRNAFSFGTISGSIRNRSIAHQNVRFTQRGARVRSRPVAYRRLLEVRAEDRRRQMQRCGRHAVLLFEQARSEAERMPDQHRASWFVDLGDAFVAKPQVRRPRCPSTNCRPRLECHRSGCFDRRSKISAEIVSRNSSPARCTTCSNVPAVTMTTSWPRARSARPRPMNGWTSPAEPTGVMTKSVLA